MKTTLALAAASMLLVTANALVCSAAPKTNRVEIRYVVPKNSAHRWIYEELKERHALEKLQEFLSPFLLPMTVKLSVAGCDGEADAFYDDEDAAITICYEYIDDLFKNRPKKTTPAGIAPIDAVIGPFFDTSLHEFAHALFDIFELPVLGREEDAADQVAAYIYLQLGKDEARRLIMGTAYAYLTEAKGDDAPLTPEEFLEDFAGEHSTPAQRAYNVLCIAYGADPKVFGDFVTRGYLPKDRADGCEEEYEQVQDAFETLIGPHIDPALAKQILDKTWLRKTPVQRR
jgi:hypothetical protein